ncbi:MAG: glycerol kinase GlpK [Pseudomonadota bacterium]
MKPCILAIDQGTTSSRAIVFDTDGAIVSTAQQEFPQHYPKAGWVEHDPEDIWSSTLHTARVAFNEAEARGGKVEAIGITNQRETSIVWDRDTLKPIANAIVWQDRRTADKCAALKRDGCEPAITEKTGLILDPYFSATKLAWLLDYIEGARASASQGKLAFGTVDAFLLARLTGGAHATDATNACRTSLYNIRNNDWDADLLEIFDIPRVVLPDVRDTASEFGETMPSIFGRAVPILSMVGDQQAAAAGQACFRSGDVKSTYGTGCFVLAATGEEIVPSSNRLLTTIALRVNGKTTYALEGSIFVAGAVIQWLRDSLKIISNAAESEDLARSVSDTSGVYLVPGFAGLGAPHWAPDARGLIAGLTRGAGRAEIVRAALESVVYQTADLLGAMAKDGAHVSRLKVDGGMTANDWLLQFLADILNVEIERPRVLETTALGAAYLAGVKGGLLASFEATEEARKVDKVFSPEMGEAKREELLAGWRHALAQALHG